MRLPERVAHAYHCVCPYCWYSDCDAVHMAYWEYYQFCYFFCYSGPDFYAADPILIPYDPYVGHLLIEAHCGRVTMSGDDTGYCARHEVTGFAI